MRDECEHGSLRRKCEVCERDDSIDQAAALFVRIGNDVGTFDPECADDNDDLAVKRWLGENRPDLLHAALAPFQAEQHDDSGSGGAR